MEIIFKKFYTESVLKALSITFILFIISSILSWSLNKAPLTELSNVLNNRENKYFPNLWDLLIEFQSILFLIFALLFYNLLVSTHEFSIISHYTLNLFEKIKKSELFLHSIFLLLFIFINFFFFSYKYFSWIFLISLILWMMFFIVKYLFIDNLIKQYLFLDFRGKINYVFKKYEVIIFFLSLLISLALGLAPNNTLFQVPFLHFAINFFTLIIIVTILHIIKMIRLEYLSASLHKQIVINNFVYKELINHLDASEKNTLNKSYQNIKNKVYRLNNRREFYKFIDELSLEDDNLKKKLKIIYDNLIIDYVILSEKLGKVIKDRNTTNLLVSLFFCIFTFFMLITFINIGFSNSTISLMLKGFFTILLFRLILRSVEIGYAFYDDIQPAIKIKKTNLTNGNRIKLVIRSLIEVSILSSLLYAFAKIIAVKELTSFNLGLIFIENIQYSFAVAFFNASFPLEYLDGIYKSVSMDYWSLPNAIRLIHLIQLFISVILISLSITSYGSKAHNIWSYNFELKNDKYYIKEINMKNNENRNLFEASSINELIENIEMSWKEKQIDSNQYLELKELIDIYFFKN